jgi:hypothetical protein
MEIIKNIQNRIYELRGERVMLDFDIAELYEVGAKVINQAAKRNIKRFPEDFMFRLSITEWKTMRSQIVAASDAFSLRSQIVTLDRRGRHSKYLPYAFTEQGIAMLSGTLNSDKAIQMNIAIMRAFVKARRLSLREMDFRTWLKEIKGVLGVHDSQLNQIYDAMENLLDEKAAHKKWNERERIGFKK